jgi:hypothetical protein
LGSVGVGFLVVASVSCLAVMFADRACGFVYFFCWVVFSVGVFEYSSEVYSHVSVTVGAVVGSSVDGFVAVQFYVVVKSGDPVLIVDVY